MFDSTGTGPQPTVRLVFDTDPDADLAPPWPTPDRGPRAFLRRRQEQRITEAHQAGRVEVTDAHACAAATALIPEDFLAACRANDTTPREVTISGMPVTIIPSRRTSNADPEAEIAAWANFRHIVLAATLAATGDLVSTETEMPPQITAAYWQTSDGYQMRVTAGCTQIGWLRRRIPHIPGGGVASVVPVLGGITAGKFTSAAAVLAVGVVMAVAPGHSIIPLIPNGVDHNVQEFVPSFGAFEVKDMVTPTPRPPRRSAKRGPSSAGQAPGPSTAIGSQVPSPQPSTTPEEQPVPPVEAEVSPSVPLAVQDAPTPRATVPVAPSVAPSVVPPVGVAPSVLGSGGVSGG